MLFRLSAIRVKQIGDLLKGEERNSQGQQHRANGETQARQCPKVGNEEVRVFVIANNAEIRADAQYGQYSGG